MRRTAQGSTGPRCGPGQCRLARPRTRRRPPRGCGRRRLPRRGQKRRRCRRPRRPPRSRGLHRTPRGPGAGSRARGRAAATRPRAGRPSDGSLSTALRPTCAANPAPGRSRPARPSRPTCPTRAMLQSAGRDSRRRRPARQGRAGTRCTQPQRARRRIVQPRQGSRSRPLRRGRRVKAAVGGGGRAVHRVLKDRVQGSCALIARKGRERAGLRAGPAPESCAQARRQCLPPGAGPAALIAKSEHV